MLARVGRLPLPGNRSDWVDAFIPPPFPTERSWHRLLIAMLAADRIVMTLAWYVA